MSLSLLIIFITGFVTIVGAGSANFRYESWSKVLTTLAYSGVALTFFKKSRNNHSLVFAIALIFAAIADYFLSEAKHLPKESPLNGKYFIIGLALYLVGYLTIGISNIVFYSINSTTTVVFIIISIVSFIIYRTLDKSKMKGIEIPVIAYLGQAVILVSSSSTKLFITNFQLPAILLALGSICFYVSDFLIAKKTFNSNFMYSEPLILITYNCGLYFISYGILHMPESPTLSNKQLLM